MEGNRWKRKAAGWLFSLFLALMVLSGCFVAVDFIRSFREEWFWERIRQARDKGLAAEEEWIPGDILPEYRELYEKTGYGRMADH